MSHTFAVCKKCRALNRIRSEKAREAVCGKCQTPISFNGLVSEVNTEDFHRILKASDVPVIVDFWASWCGPCKTYGPEFERASLQNTNAVFLKISTETEQMLSSSLNIRGIPCTIVFKGGKEVKRQPGAMNADEVGALIRSIPPG